MRAACLARLAAAAIRIVVSYLGSRAPRQRDERVDALPALGLGLERLEGPQRQGDVLGQLGVFRRACRARARAGPSARRATPGRCRSWDRAGSSWPARTPDRQLADGRPQLPDILHRVALAAGQLAEQQPDDDHHHDHHRRDHEELHHEPSRWRLDRRQVGECGGVGFAGIAAGVYEWIARLVVQVSAGSVGQVVRVLSNASGETGGQGFHSLFSDPLFLSLEIRLRASSDGAFPCQM